MLPRELRQYSNRNVFMTLGAIIAVSFVATAATLAALALLSSIRQTGQVNNTAKAQLQSLLLQLNAAESNRRGYVITGNPSYQTRFVKAASIVRSSLQSLDQDTITASYHQDIENLRTLVNTQFKASAVTPDSLASTTATMDQVQTLAASIETTQTAQLNRDRNHVQFLSDIARDVSLLTLILTLTLAIFMYYLYLTAIQSERRLDRAKDEFVSLASHQLRTPATGIKSILSTLVAGDFGPLNDRQTYFMHRAIESNERGLGIIEELLNVARADAGRLILRSAEFELGPLISAIAGEQKGAITEKHQQLSIKQPNRPLKIFADEEKLYMAIGNLLDNARKYTPEFGKITLSIYARHGEVYIEVADTGMGIHPDELERIFDRFQRASDAIRGNVEGTGLGLYLARRIAELQGGTIEVTSRLGKGTKFVMILPQGDYRAAKSPSS